MEWIIGIIVLWIAWRLLTSKYRRELAMKQIIVDAYIHHESDIVYSKIYWEAAKRYAEDHGATIDKYFDEDSFNYDTYINEVKVHVYIARDSSGYALFKVEEHKKMMQKFNEKFGIIDESWIERLWKWADENEISDDEIPRNKEKLLNLTELSLNFNQLTELPKEIGNLTNLISLHLGGNQLTELPKEITNLILKSLDLEDSPNLILTSEQKKWIRGLISKYGTAWDGIHIGINIDNDLLDKEDDEEIPF